MLSELIDSFMKLQDAQSTKSLYDFVDHLVVGICEYRANKSKGLLRNYVYKDIAKTNIIAEALTNTLLNEPFKQLVDAFNLLSDEKLAREIIYEIGTYNCERHLILVLETINDMISPPLDVIETVFVANEFSRLFNTYSLAFACILRDIDLEAIQSMLQY